MSWRDDLPQLVDDHLAGRLEGDGRAALERLLAEQPAARQQFWVMANHEVMLRSVFAGASTAVADMRPPTPVRLRQWRHVLLATAALVFIAIGVALTIWSADAVQPVAVIGSLVVVGDPGVVRHADGGQTPIRDGLPIRADDRIITGANVSLDLRWPDEATVITLSGGSAVTLPGSRPTTATLPIEQERLVLEHGAVVAQVAHQPTGRRFAIATPQAHVTVIGTRFTVRVSVDRTEVDVEHGRVSLATPSGEKPVEIGAGERAMRIAGQAPVIVPRQTWGWKDRRPIGVMMLCRDNLGWATNPRGWFNDQAIDITTPEGLAAFHRRLDAQLDLTIALLREQDAQGVVFWDLEGRGQTISYAGDPRQIARFAPEMDAVADRLFARLRAAGFAVGMALRAQDAVWAERGAGPQLRTVADPAALLADKVAYARTRWGATLFPVLGQSGSTIGMETITRRVVALHPDVLVMASAADADTYRWCGVWQDDQAPSLPDPTTARRAIEGAFGVYKALDAPLLEQRFADLVRGVVAGDILTFRAWWRDPGHAVLKRIRDAARPAAP